MNSAPEASPPPLAEGRGSGGGVLLPLRRWGPAGASPLVLLHGFLGRADDWAEVAEGLSARSHLLAPDLPGHGEALGLPEEAYTMSGASHALLAALDAEGVPSFDLAGYSMGGRLALLVALCRPERVRRVVLISASPGLQTGEERAARRTLDVARAAEIADDLPGFVERWYAMPLFATLDDATRARLVADRQAHGDPGALARALIGMGTGTQPSLWEPLRHLRVPAWAVAGERDAKFAALARRMAGAGPITSVVLPGVGHAVPAEAPAALADLLADLLS